jgi:hypothetical protein
MFGKDLLKHIREIRRYVANWQYELTPEGILFPKATAIVRGTYEHWVRGYESEVAFDHNLVPDEGLNHFLSVVLKSGTPVTSWYLGLHSGSGTPTAALTAANYNATLSEIQASSGDPGGYTEGTRVAWVGDAVDTVNTEVVNNASPAAFTVSTTTTLVVNGACLMSKSGKTDYTGVLASAGKFTAARNLANTDVFNLKYKVDFDAV